MFDVRTIQAGSLINIVYDTPLKSNEVRVVVDGNCGFNLAKNFEDVMAIHKAIYSSLVSQPADRPEQYNYLMFHGADGRIHVAADAWIRSVVVIGTMDAIIKVRDIGGTEALETIRLALAARGFTDVTIESVENKLGA